ANRRVAELFGSINWVTGTLRASNVAETPLGLVHTNRTDGIVPGSQVLLGIRPEAITLRSPGRIDAGELRNHFQAEVLGHTFLGGRWEFRVRIGDVELSVSALAGQPMGDQVVAVVEPDNVL